jgi:hypothetical protein
MVIAADYPFLDIVFTMLIFFAWVVWIWMMIMILSDVFRRHDISGWGKGSRLNWWRSRGRYRGGPGRTVGDDR